jgi:hypothetical protein
MLKEEYGLDIDSDSSLRHVMKLKLKKEYFLGIVLNL